MSGWRRLWAVLSITLGAPLFAIQFLEDRQVFVSHSASSVLAGFDVETHGGLILWEAAQSRPALKDCNPGSIEMSRNELGGYDIRCTRSAWTALFPALWYALVPALAMAGIGLIVRWVYRGFRPAAEQQ